MKENRFYYQIIGCYVMWGLLPLFWRLFSSISALYLLSWRLIGATIFGLIVVFLEKKQDRLRSAVTDRKVMLKLAAAAFTIAINYGACTYAFISGKILESSLGNFMCPVLTFCVGAGIFKEKTNNGQKISMGLVCIGVMISVVAYGDVPYIALMISIPFATYSAIKRTLVDIDSIISIEIENMVLFPIAVIVWISKSGVEISRLSTNQLITLVLLCGVATTTPILLFSKGVKKIPYMSLGFLQYISPILSMISGMCLGERPSISKLVTFAFVIVAAIIFSRSTYKENNTFSMNKC